MVALHHNGTRFWGHVTLARTVTRTHTACTHSLPIFTPYSLHAHCVPPCASGHSVIGDGHTLSAPFPYLYATMYSVATDIRTVSRTGPHLRQGLRLVLEVPTDAHTRTHYQATPCLHTVAPHNPHIDSTLLHTCTHSLAHMPTRTILVHELAPLWHTVPHLPTH